MVGRVVDITVKIHGVEFFNTKINNMLAHDILFERLCPSFIDCIGKYVESGYFFQPDYNDMSLVEKINIMKDCLYKQYFSLVLSKYISLN